MRDDTDRPAAPNPKSSHVARGPNGEPMSRLLRAAGRRPAVPESVVAEIKRVTHPAWQAKVQAVARARRRRRVWTLAAAASLLVSAGMLVWRLAPGFMSASSVRVATLEAADGASIHDDGFHVVAASTVTLVAGDGVDAGSSVETGSLGFATLRLAGGASARLDADTVVRFESASAFELLRGAVYLDTGSASGATLEVTTAYGVARDIGTQFEVRVLEDAVRIQVREGEVELDMDDASHVAPAGTALTIGATGDIAREDLPAHGSAWTWVLRTSPVFELEGRTLGEFLDWVARETGWQPRFADPELERDVMATVVHGSIAGVRPDQAPDLVLPSSGLRYRIENGTMWIEQAGTRPAK